MYISTNIVAFSLRTSWWSLSAIRTSFTEFSSVHFSCFSPKDLFKIPGSSWVFLYHCLLYTPAFIIPLPLWYTPAFHILLRLLYLCLPYTPVFHTLAFHRLHSILCIFAFTFPSVTTLAWVAGGIRERASERRSCHIPSRSPRGNSRAANPLTAWPLPLYQNKSTRARNPASYAGYYIVSIVHSPFCSPFVLLYGFLSKLSVLPRRISTVLIRQFVHHAFLTKFPS